MQMPTVLKSTLDWSQSLMSFFSSKADILSKIANFKLYLE